MPRLALLLLAAGCVLLAGCFTPPPVAKLDAYEKLRPVVEAIEAFKRTQGRVPESIEELQAVTRQTFKLQNSGGEGIRWTINYEKKSPTSYQVGYYHVHYTLIYRDGREAGWTFNPWA